MMLDTYPFFFIATDRLAKQLSRSQPNDQIAGTIAISMDRTEGSINPST